MQISVVIPTCDRRARLLSLLESLDRSAYPFLEVIVVDAGSDRLMPADHALFNNLSITCLRSEKSVCIQRNLGINHAKAAFVFLCDDDIEVPAGYVCDLVDHLHAHADAGAVSGLFLQKEKGEWTARYPLQSVKTLIWTFIFQMSIWGNIDVSSNSLLVRKIKAYYRRKGNHLSRAGWPVITDLSGPYFITRLYSLGACLVKKEWLLQSPFDEVLDRHGMGDNYGVALGFPGNRIDVLNHAFVYHHREPLNRLQRPQQYFRRALALDYFIQTKKTGHAARSWLLWSLTGKLLAFILAGDRQMIRPAIRTILAIAGGRNPYIAGARSGKKLIEPLSDSSFKPWSRPKPPRRILAIRLQATGDVMITLPYLQRLRNTLPSTTRLDFLTRTETADVPRNLRLFDRVFTIAGGRSPRKQLCYAFLLLPALFRRRYDMVIDLQNNRISRIIRKMLRPAAWSEFDRFSPIPAGERTRRTIAKAGLEENEPDLRLRLNDPAKGKDILQRHGWDGKQMLVVLNPAGASETRNWDMANYIRFARLWLEKFPDTRFLVLGTSFIAEKAELLKQALEDRLIDLVGRTSPSEAFAVIQAVNLVLSEDSGLMHMSWISGISTVVLFGSTRSDWSRPLGPHSFFLDSSDLPCGNCMQAICRRGDNHCLARVTPAQVFLHAFSLINRVN